jgi:hypothetical protein
MDVVGVEGRLGMGWRLGGRLLFSRKHRVFGKEDGGPFAEIFFLLTH